MVRISVESGHQLEWVSEDNYKFRLSAFEQPLLEWLENNPNAIRPQHRHEEVVRNIKAGLSDLSVSRLRSKVAWSIPVPTDADHGVYVWLDALTNYIASTGYPDQTKDGSPKWPAEYQIIGKDILRFHAIYWPAFLLGAGLPLPQTIYAHGHWTIDHVKMSKSLGNVVSPSQLVEEFGVDATRYFLLKEGGVVQDNNFSRHEMALTVNNDLADTLGNLFSRATGKTMVKAIVALQQEEEVGGAAAWPLTEFEFSESRALLDELASLPEKVDACFTQLNFAEGVSLIHRSLSATNGYFANLKPWELRRTNKQQLFEVLSVTFECVRVSTLLLQPIMPTAATRVLDSLHVPTADRTYDHSMSRFASGDLLSIFAQNFSSSKASVLFPKVDVPPASP